MKVVIVGPNLRDQSKGQFHVHAEGCADLRRDPVVKNEDQSMVVEVVDRLEVEDYIYGPDAGDFDVEPGSALDEFHFAPCTSSLPERASVMEIVRQTKNGDGRFALVAADVERVAAYLPANYHAYPIALDGGTVEWVRGQQPHTLIAGQDNAGWTLDGYVIPRLASGLYFAEEVSFDELLVRTGLVEPPEVRS